MKLIADYFNLSKREQYAMLLLLGIIMVILILRISLPTPGLSAKQLVDIQLRRQQIQAQLDKNQSGDSKANDSYREPDKHGNHYQSKSGVLSFFDPNLTTEAQFSKLGFKEWQIKNIVNYRKAGGKFQKPTDLKKLYSIKQADYEKYSPFIRISGVEGKNEKPVPSVQHQKLLRIDLNTADTTELMKLKGIGSYFARKIVEHRGKLGGYVKEEQLLEIYHFPPELLLSIRAQLFISAGSVRKMNLNKATVQELRAHPYVSGKVALAIVKYREQHGAYTAIKEISNSVLIGDSLCSKIAPYFKIDD